MITKMKPSMCFISKSVSDHHIKDKNQAEAIFNDMQMVPIENNSILDEIMRNRYNWSSNPTIFVNNIPYKLKLLEVTNKSVTMYQMYIKILTKANGKEWYEVINRRRVKIIFV